MTVQRIIEWLILAATAWLFGFIKWMHWQVLHYNWFLIIMLAWTAGVVVYFWLTLGPKGGEPKDANRAEP